MTDAVDLVGLHLLVVDPRRAACRRPRAARTRPEGVGVAGLVDPGHRQQQRGALRLGLRARRGRRGQGASRGPGSADDRALRGDLDEPARHESPLEGQPYRPVDRVVAVDGQPGDARRRRRRRQRHGSDGASPPAKSSPGGRARTALIPVSAVRALVVDLPADRVRVAGGADVQGALRAGARCPGQPGRHVDGVARHHPPPGRVAVEVLPGQSGSSPTSRPVRSVRQGAQGQLDELVRRREVVVRARARRAGQRGALRPEPAGLDRQRTGPGRLQPGQGVVARTVGRGRRQAVGGVAVHADPGDPGLARVVRPVVVLVPEHRPGHGARRRCGGGDGDGRARPRDRGQAPDEDERPRLVRLTRPPGAPAPVREPGDSLGGRRGAVNRLDGQSPQRGAWCPRAG